jgi:imidazoleglycerol-phosphate dehydratase
MKKRQAKFGRKTKETQISGRLIIDGTGESSVETGIGFLDHMLTLFSFHGLFDLDLTAKGDLNVDTHHTNEDIGIVLGKAFKEALGDCEGIKRFGSASVPMDEAHCSVMVDVSGRGSVKFSLKKDTTDEAPVNTEGYSMKDAQDMFESFAKNSGINVVVEYEPGKDVHHTLEAIFKAFGISLDRATQIDPRRKGVPSTKGVID